MSSHPASPATDHYAFQYSDEILLLEPQLQVHLYLYLSKHEILASLFSERKNKFLSLESVPLSSTSFRKFLSERNNTSKESIVKTHVVFENDRQTLLPASLVKEEDIQKIFDFN